MASLQVDVPEVEEVSSHAEDINNKPSLETQSNQNEEHDYVEEEQEDLENVTPNHENDDKPGDDEDEDELLTGSQIIDEGAKSTGAIEFSDEDEADDDD